MYSLAPVPEKADASATKDVVSEGDPRPASFPNLHRLGPGSATASLRGRQRRHQGRYRRIGRPRPFGFRFIGKFFARSDVRR